MPDTETSGPMNAPEGMEFVDLESLDPKADDSELQQTEASDPGSDSPGDDAMLRQEELYEGLSSDSQPSDKLKES